MATQSERRIIRKEAESRDCRYRITGDGAVHFFGTMPNSTASGWWLFAQSIEGALSEITRRSGDA